MSTPCTMQGFLLLLNACGQLDSAMLDVPMDQYTSLSIGGPADVLMIARTSAELVAWLGFARQVGLPSIVLGGGTNVLIADTGIRGLVVINATSQFEIDDQGLLIADSGVPLGELAEQTINAGWAGLAWAIGVPGTLGGAAVGNAGAYGGCLADNLQWLSLLNADGSVRQATVAELAYGYRTSALKRITERAQRPIVIEAALQLAPGDVAALRAQADTFNQRRIERTPRGNSAGSMFKRTLQYPAGYLIEQAGLKGFAIGDAVVSPVHANFLMNAGHATAEQMRQLIIHVQNEVWRKFALRLEPEVEFVGQWPENNQQWPQQAAKGEQ